jgi:hypothetical protein
VADFLAAPVVVAFLAVTFLAPAVLVAFFAVFLAGLSTEPSAGVSVAWPAAGLPSPAEAAFLVVRLRGALFAGSADPAGSRGAPASPVGSEVAEVSA